MTTLLCNAPRVLIHKEWVALHERPEVELCVHVLGRQGIQDAVLVRFG